MDVLTSSEPVPPTPSASQIKDVGLNGGNNQNPDPIDKPKSFSEAVANAVAGVDAKAKFSVSVAHEATIPDEKAVEVDSLRGHSNAVSCALFHARKDIIVSASIDKSVRVWDLSKRTCLQTYCRENDGFWTLSAHPEENLVAAGHDSGMIVFKLGSERPAYVVSGGSLLYIKAHFLRTYDFATQKDIPLMPVCEPGSSGLINQAPRYLSYSRTENVVLICSDGAYKLHVVPRDTDSLGISDPKRGTADSAAFVARNRFAVLDKTHDQVIIKSLNNEETRKCHFPFMQIEFSLQGPADCFVDQKIS